MEDDLKAEGAAALYCPIATVSILVLMEDDLKAAIYHPPKNNNLSFNPCFNGRWSESISRPKTLTVYIRCFNPCFNGRWSERCHRRTGRGSATICFNPCFNWRWSERRTTPPKNTLNLRFNPCFNGRWSESFDMFRRARPPGFQSLF